MLHNVEPNRKRSKAGGLSLEEKRLAKGLLQKGYFVQDVVFVLNQGREAIINQSAVHPLSKNKKITPANDEEIQSFLSIQKSYDPRTLLSPFKHPRLIRAREAMISAVQIFNSPTIMFKTETFAVLANIAWTYLLHQKLEDTKAGSSVLGNKKAISVSELLTKQFCPIDGEPVKENLKQIIRIRDSVEHVYHADADFCFGGLFQACCINFNHYLTKWYGAHLTLENELSLALQFVGLTKNQFVELDGKGLPEGLVAILKDVVANPYFDNSAFTARVFYSLEATSKTGSDIHKLIDYNSLPEGLEPTHVVMKKVSRKKITEKQLVKIVQGKGYKKFSAYEHQQFWKSKWRDADTRNKKGTEYGEYFNGWGWFEEKWLPEVLAYCESAKGKFK